ncbi:MULTISPECIES: hypothetical protein [Streptomyces]|uniref:Uncharacterized protein n=2 Tax=Streptomyces TaxID=1883 RepID=A0ABV9J5P2_9ACTN
MRRARAATSLGRSQPGIRGAHEKGGVEGQIGWFRRNHLVPVPKSRHRELREIDSDDVPDPLHPEPGGLHPWGTTTNSHRLHWYPKHGHIVVIGRAGNWEWTGAMTGFLTRQKLTCPLIPGRFPSSGFTTEASPTR